MRMFWGLLIIFSGFWLLMDNFSYWDNIDFRYITYFWPLLVIIFGISVLVRHLKFGWLIIVLSFLVSIGLVVAFLSNSALRSKINISTKDLKTSSFSEDLPGGATKSEIKIESGASTISLASSNEKLIEGTLESNIFNPVLSVDQNTIEPKVGLKMEPGSKITNLNNVKNNFNIYLTNRIPLDITIDSGASDLNLDFDKIALANLNLNASASSVDLKVGENVLDGAKFSIKTGVSSINIELPTNIGVKISIRSGLSSKDFSGFKNQGDGAYESDNYLATNKKISLEIDAGVSSIKITRN